MSPGRRNLLIVLLLFWLLIAWLIASLRWEFDIVQNTLRIFVPGALLLGLILSIEMLSAQPDAVTLRKDLFGNTDEIKSGSYFAIPFLFTVVARIPAYPLKTEFDVEMIDTQTAKLLRINYARVRCHYRIDSYSTCAKRVFDMTERLKLIEATDKLKPTDTGLWKSILGATISGMIDDKLRENVWQWADMIAKDVTLAASLPFADPEIEIENDPYALSLNRTKLASKLVQSIEDGAKKWGLVIDRIVFEQVLVDPELIAKRTRNKPGELKEATHQATLDYIAIRARGIAEADVRARTVRRILEELVAAKNLPQLTEKMVAEIVRAAMYSDGEMIWKGVLEKSLPGAPGTAGTPPGTAKTA